MPILRGERVRELREVRQWTQPEVAQRLTQYNVVGERVSPETVSRMENGRSDASAPMLAALAQALDTTADYLLGLTDDPAIPGVPHYPIPAPESVPLVAALNSLPVARRRRTVAVLLAFVNELTSTAEASELTPNQVQLLRLLEALPAAERATWQARIAQAAAAAEQRATGPAAGTSAPLEAFG